MPAEFRPLPIDEVLAQVLIELARSGVLILQAEPGAGKTTRVPPAILDSGLAELPDKKPGKIIVLQPRRVAARAAATRIAFERASELGAEVGYQVRFEKRSSKRTRILVCTEGVFLRLLQEDPLLEEVSVVIFDEFHERSIDSDLALAMVRQVRNELRSDLRLLVMSATLDAAPVAEYLGSCRTLSCLGRSFPLTIEYLRFPGNESTSSLVFEGVKRMLSCTEGHILVFLPDLYEIRQAQQLLEPLSEHKGLALMPLFGDMPLEEQQRVLEPSAKRKIVLATNVAETSITIDGVTAVVDSGLARINRLDPRLGLNRLDLQRISKASADQRAGRAARTGPGICLRLWSEKEQQLLRDYEAPEIARVELSQCLLQLFAWGEHDIKAFPWFQPPPAQALEQALQVLDRLDALENGKLTELGKRMSRFPLPPRLARLLVEGERLGQLRRAALCAALLAERDPFRRSGARKAAEHHSDSDVLDRLLAIEEYQRSAIRDSLIGELLSGPAKKVLKISQQLEAMGKECNALANSAAAKGPASDADEAVLRAILCAYPDRVCRRRDEKGRRAVMVGGRGVRLGDESAVGEGELFVAVEILETGKSESLVIQASRIERSWLSSTHLSTSTEAAYDLERQRVMAMRRTKFCDLVIEEVQVPLPAEFDSSAVLARAVIEHFELETLLDDESKQYLARLHCLREWLPSLELPEFDQKAMRELLPDWCSGCTGIHDLQNKSLVPIVQLRLNAEQITAIEREAPERINVPSGSRVKVVYEPEIGRAHV